jgi:hypothetical protein
MRTLGWFTALLLNGVVVFAALMLAVDSASPATVRTVACIVAALALSAVALLVLARLTRLPRWGSTAMRYVCLSFPVLWLLGSLDHGILSGQELLSVIVVAVFAWGTWRVFQLHSPTV